LELEELDEPQAWPIIKRTAAINVDIRSRLRRLVVCTLRTVTQLSNEISNRLDQLLFALRLVSFGIPLMPGV